MQPTYVPSLPRWARPIAVVAIFAVLAACSGSDGDGDGDLSGLAGDATSTTIAGGSVPSGAVDGGATIPPGSPTTVGSAGRDGSTGGGTATTSAPQRGGGTGGGPVKLGLGVTESTITLGFSQLSDVGAANAAVGGSSARAGETPRKDYGDPLIKWFNENGGIAGRKIVPVWADVKVTPNNTMASNRQSVCATLTQDNKVFAAQLISTLMYADVLECLKKAGSLALLTAEAQYTIDDEALRKWPHVYLPMSFALDRQMRVFADSVIKNNFVDNKLARVGLAYYRTDGASRAVAKVLKPALVGAGITITAEQAFTPTESVDSLAQTQAEAQSAVLRFRAGGVTHVIFAIANGAFLTGPFISNAEQQGWRPRYMFNTSTFPGAAPGSKANAQLNRSLLLSWSSSDQGWEQGYSKTPRMQQCLSILKAGGHPPPRDGLMGQELAWFCDYLFFMKDTLEGVTDFTHAGFAAAVARQPAKEPVWTYRSHLPGGRRDAAAAYRMATYDPGCGCYPLTAPLTPAP